MESEFGKFVLFIHSTLRWIILFSFSIAFLKSIISFLTKDRITASIVIGNKISMILMDIQIILGLSLYFFFSSITKAAFLDLKLAMTTKEFRFFTIEHITTMLLATISFHVVNIVLKKNYTQQKKIKIITAIYFLILVLFIVGIPWFRPIFREI